MNVPDSYQCFFKKATGNEPYDYQLRLAVEEELPALVEIPTGLGKTAAVVLAWLWRRRFAPVATRIATPRRLVYCLPMRVLVEQTLESCVRWLHRLDLLAGTVAWDSVAGGRLKKYEPNLDAYDHGANDPEHGRAARPIAVHVLMGGEDAAGWDVYPEQDVILLGTQDMLLSRALNRGYALSRNRWPVQFGLLNNDCLWVFDEIQLMGSGLATSAQLEAFRKKFWPPASACQSVWMSATLDPFWLHTVDFDPTPLRPLELQGQDLATEEVSRRFNAKKPIRKAKHLVDDPRGLADEIKLTHRPGTRTLVVANTVRRARDLHAALEKCLRKAKDRPELVLIHSRFRPPDRQRVVDRLLADPGPQGTIVVSTQVVEAGVDVSAKTLFTELAPWASLVQRFGRCNRAGTDADAQVFWIDIPSRKKAQDAALPYDVEDLELARKHLGQCRGVGPADLPDFPHPQLRDADRHVVRSKDLLELFDTTPDLAGNDLDIDRYVRGADSSDVHVFWRDWGENVRLQEGAPQREELCPVPVGEFRDFLRSAKSDRSRLAYRWDFLEKEWVKADAETVYPGQVYLLHVSAGGYSAEIGWDAKADAAVAPLVPSEATSDSEANEADPGSEVDRWQSIAEHTDEVCKRLDAILATLTIREAEPLRLAARWHDRGKAHSVFQDRILSERGGQPRPVTWAPPDFVAKAPGPNKATGDAGWWAPQYARRHFRHELASALAVLLWPDGSIDPHVRDLVAYLVAAHHGKVRLSLRSLPREQPPDRPDCNAAGGRFARGVWDGDTLPATALGAGMVAPEVQLSLEPMEVGLCQSPPFANQPSWAERMLRLRDQLGPFRLAFLEALLRAADWRASGAHHPLERPA